MSCKAFFSGKSPYITLSSGKCLIRVRIYIFTLLEFRGAIYYVAIATVIFSRVEMVKLSCFCVKAHRISLGFIS